jgi:predicted ATPase/DNA-binding CsgD family transcriptional regulator/Tfp pilus assembly protein PilF
MSAAPGETPTPTLVPAFSMPNLRLPIAPTPFIGRERQMTEVCSLLERDSVRLLTLTGPGGIGKTRLALAVAEGLRNSFPGGVYGLSLAPITDSRLVGTAIAVALGAPQSGRDGGVTDRAATLQHLESLIGHRKILLMLDNFEQVIDAADDIAALLRACARLKVLVTSREKLSLSAEQCYPVPPLALPDLKHLPPLEYLAQMEAVHLFVSRAQAVRPDFALTPDNAEAVVSICHNLDGLPLAIELAAARVSLLPPPLMLARLERRLLLLTEGPRDAPARHQTLRAAIAWSYELLEPHEQQLFRRLSVFAGGSTLEAIEAVCLQPDPHNGADGGARTSQTLVTLASLINKSLLLQSQQETGQSRYFMLETIREYALEQLAEKNERESMLRAYAQYYLSLAENAEGMLTGADQLKWFDLLEQEHDNMRGVLNWSVERGELEKGARVAAALWRFWLTRGYLSEGLRWLDTVLTSGYSLAPALRARALNGAGRLAVRQGDFAAAQRVLEESLAIWRSSADWKEGRLEPDEMQILHGLGLVALYQADFARSQSYFEQNLQGWRSLGDNLGMAQTLNNLGLALRYQGEFEQAQGAFEECLELSRELQHRYGIGAALHNMGQLAHHRGDDATAHRLLSESLAIGQQIGDKPNISARLADLAAVWAEQGDPIRAARIFGAADALREKTGATMYGGQRAVYEMNLQSAAAKIDADTWKSAWDEGRAMSYEEACALAVAELPTQTTSHAAFSPFNPKEYDLSERVVEVLCLLAAGLTYAEIAERLTVSFHTVHAHLRSVYHKLGVTSRSQAARFAVEHKLV